MTPSVQALQPTHIGSLDEILHGGIPYGSVVLVSGPAGSGKTIMTQQWLMQGATQAEETGLYLTFTEDVDKALRNLSQFDFFEPGHIKSGKVRFVDGRTLLAGMGLDESSSLSLSQMDELLTVIMNLVDQMQARRVAIDSITALIYKIGDVDAVRNFIFRLGYRLSRPNATIWLLGEHDTAAGSSFPVERFISDGIIALDSRSGGNQRLRRLEVQKLRGASYRSGPAYFDILPQGILLYPKIPSYSLTAKTDFSHRRGTGVARLDEMMGGGIPQGHMLLVGGNTGSGKTTLAMHFLHEGLRRGEKGLFVSLEESLTQIVKTAHEHGWDFQRHLDDGQLFNVTSDLIDIYTDKLLYEIVRTVEDNHIERVVIDSISSLESASLNRDDVREFMLQIVAFFKSRGIICLMTYLTTDMFAASTNQLLGGTASNELRLSSVVDAIILMRYVERDQEVRKLLSVLKLRGSTHDKRIYEFSVGRAGLVIGEPFKR